MIDTMILFFDITTIQYSMLYKPLMAVSLKYHKLLYPSSRRKQYSRYMTTCFMNQVIMEIALVHSTSDITSKKIEIKIPPKVLLDSQNYHDASNIDDMLIVRKKINKPIQDFSEILPDLFDWKCKCIDYAVNIKIRYVAQYISLFNRGNITRCFSRSIEKMLQYQGSFYISTETRDLTINFYDKYDLFLKQSAQNSYHNLTDLKPFKNQLRLEVQCGKKKIDCIKILFSLPDSILRNYISPDISYYVITYYYNLITGNCDKNFLPFNMIQGFLSKSTVLTKSDISKISSFFAMLEYSQGLWAMRKQYNGKDTQYHKVLSLIRKYGFQPL